MDELDVKTVQTGQQVVVTADAVSGKTFSGAVTNISLQSASANGVTTYPVTVTLQDGMDELLPGMNVDGVIVLAGAKDVLSVPADALVRGNLVYVKDDSVKEASGIIPAGFRPVQVTTGVISGDYVEIVSGLEEGQEVYVAQSTVRSDTGYTGPGGMGGPGMGMPGGAGGSGGGTRVVTPGGSGVRINGG